MKKPVLCDNRGMTLIELLVGVVILAIVVVPLMHLFITSANTERKNEIYGNATNVAQNQIEEIEAANMEEYMEENHAVPDATAQSYTIKHADVNNGGSSFDVLVTLNVNTIANTTKVAFDNPMDAIVDMNSADQSALNELNAELTGLTNVTPLPVLGNLNRTITINATKVTDGYSLDVSFNYIGSFSGTDINEKTIPVSFNYSIGSSADVKASTSVSLYMFFQAFYSSKDTIVIKNPDYTNSDFKVFLVNTNTNTPAPGYKADIRYFYQTDKNKSLVFTNISISSYKAFYTDSTWFQAIPTADAALVELKKLDRMYSVDVKVYQPGTSYSGTPLAEMSSDKLNR